MAIITDPDDLSQGLSTGPTDAAWTSSSGASTTITGSASLPLYTAGDYFEVRDHSTPGNNGLYVATGTPTTSSLSCDKVDGTNPADASAEAITMLGDSGATADQKSVMIDTSQKRIYLLEQGLLSTDGVTLQALYSFLKEEWKADADLIQNTFPVVSITPEQFEFSDNWEPRDVTSPAIQSKKLIRTAGWTEVSDTDIDTARYSGVITLGSFEDEANDTAYYQLGDDPTDTSAAVSFTFAGPVNEAILVYDDFGVPGDVTVTGTDTINSTGSDFVAAGFKIGGRVTVSNANTSANDGDWTITDVQTTSITVSGTLTNDAGPDTTMRLAVNNQAAVQLFLRIRDGDTNGKTYDSSNVAAIGFSEVDNKAFRYPLANATDLNITATDAGMSGSPYTEIVVKYFDQAFSIDVDSATNRDFGIVIDVGTHSGVDGSFSAAGSTLTSAEGGLWSIFGTGTFDGGTLTIWEGSDDGTSFPISTTTDTTITLASGTFTATESNISFSAQRSTPVVATKTEIYEKVQFLLRQSFDIDTTTNVVAGNTADETLVFVGSDLLCGSLTPSNPNGGGDGVIIVGFDANDTNNLFFFDNTGTSRNYPFVAAGSITFNTNLYPGDTSPEYWMFFEYTSRTTVSDLAISGVSGDTASIDSSGAELPTAAQFDYFRLTDMTNPENNGIWVITDASPTTSQFDARKVDGQTVVAEGPASHPLDLDPIDSPQAIIVNDNGGSPISGTIGASSVSFDFDYDNNVQGGRTAATDAAIVIRAIGLETGQFAETSGTITRAVGLSFSVVSALERNYANP